MTNLESIKDFWNKNPCNEWFFPSDLDPKEIEKLKVCDYERQSRLRYRHEPEIIEFADFLSYNDQDVLEIGYGLGADAINIAREAKTYTGIDASSVSQAVTLRRFQLYRLKGDIRLGTATSLPFSSDSFSRIYSWGCIHHSGDIGLSIKEMYRVLVAGGKAKVMIYNKYSLVVITYWLLYAARYFKFYRSLSKLMAENIESPGTLVLSKREARSLFESRGFKVKRIRLFRPFFFRLKNYPALFRPLIRFYAITCISIFGGKSSIGYFMCIDLEK